MEKLIKILSLVINYGANQSNFCQNLVNSLFNIEYSNEIIVFSDRQNDLDNCSQIICQNYNGFDFGMNAIDYLKNSKLDEYTHILVTENDLLFKNENFKTFFNHEHKLNQNEAIGFLRYEFLNGQKYLVDGNYGSNKLSLTSPMKEILEIDESYFTPTNCHQGCFFLRKDQLQEVLSKINIGIELEEKVSKVYFGNQFPGSDIGIKRKIPIKEIENILIHHQPNKYVNIYKDLPNIQELNN
jgi:hypothetical protein